MALVEAHFEIALAKVYLASTMSTTNIGIDKEQRCSSTKREVVATTTITHLTLTSSLALD